MLRLTSIVLVILAAVGASTHAHASDQTVVDKYFSPWSAAKGLDTLRHLAFCVVERHPSEAQAFVREVGTDTELSEHSEALIDPKCIKMYFFRSSITRISPPTYLPLLAEALLMRAYAAESLPSVERVAPLDHPALPNVPIESVHPRYRDDFIADKSLVQLEIAAECVARAETSRGFILALTPPNSPAENEALANLNSAIANCGGNKFGVVFPPFATRGALVMNLYRLADAVRPITLQKVVR